MQKIVPRNGSYYIVVDGKERVPTRTVEKAMAVRTFLGEEETKRNEQATLQPISTLVDFQVKRRLKIGTKSTIGA